MTPLLAVFLAAFAAATLLPFPSEAPLALYVARGGAPLAAVLVATAGNVLGAATTYLVGRGVLQLWRRRHPEPDSAALRRLRRYGAPILLLSWVPVAGDALVLGAGVLRVPWPSALLWTALGKAARYAGVAWAAGRIAAGA